jgi:hypothetical protein
MGRKGGHKKFNRRKRPEQGAAEGEEALKKKVKTNEEGAGQQNAKLKKPRTKEDMKNALFERYYRVLYYLIFIEFKRFNFSKKNPPDIHSVVV